MTDGIVVGARTGRVNLTAWQPAKKRMIDIRNKMVILLGFIAFTPVYGR
jgi:hypothetical protein